MKPKKPKNRWFGTTRLYHGKWRGTVSFYDAAGVRRSLTFGPFFFEIEAARAAWRAKMEINPQCGWPYPEEADPPARKKGRI